MATLTELYQRYDDLLALIGALLVAFQALVAGVVALAKLLGKLALLTQSKADDEFLAKLSLGLGYAHDALVRWQRFIPRARLGKAREPMVGSSIRPPPSARLTAPPAPPPTAPEAPPEGPSP